MGYERKRTNWWVQYIRCLTVAKTGIGWLFLEATNALEKDDKRPKVLITDGGWTHHRGPGRWQWTTVHLQMRNGKLREVKWVARDHTASKKLCWHSNPICFSLEPKLLRKVNPYKASTFYMPGTVQGVTLVLTHNTFLLVAFLSPSCLGYRQGNESSERLNNLAKGWIWII